MFDHFGHRDVGYSAAAMLRRKVDHPADLTHALSRRLRLSSSYFDEVLDRKVPYRTSSNRRSARSSYTASIRSVLQGTEELRGQSVVMLGILVLIATPVVRVAASVVLFAAE